MSIIYSFSKNLGFSINRHFWTQREGISKYHYHWANSHLLVPPPEALVQSDLIPDGRKALGVCCDSPLHRGWDISPAIFPAFRGGRALATSSASGPGHRGLRLGDGPSTPEGGCLLPLSLHPARQKHCPAVPSPLPVSPTASFSHYTEFQKGLLKIRLLCQAGRPLLCLCQFKEGAGSGSSVGVRAWALRAMGSNFGSATLLCH